MRKISELSPFAVDSNARLSLIEYLNSVSVEKEGRFLLLFSHGSVLVAEIVFPFHKQLVVFYAQWILSHPVPPVANCPILLFVAMFVEVEVIVEPSAP